MLLIVSSICAVCTSRVSNWCSNLSIRAVIWRKRHLKKKSPHAPFGLDMWHLSDTLLFLNSLTSARYPCFEPLRPWTSWPAKTNHISQRTKKQDGWILRLKDFKNLRFAICSTCFIVTAVWTLEATASTRALIRRKFTDWFFCLMAFSAWIRATSMFPFWIAWRIHEHDAPQQKICSGHDIPSQILAKGALLTFFTLIFSAFSSLSHFLEFLCRSLEANFKLKRCSATWD